MAVSYFTLTFCHISVVLVEFDSCKLDPCTGEVVARLEKLRGLHASGIFQHYLVGIHLHRSNAKAIFFKILATLNVRKH